jgi:hypothetical protein
MNHFIFNQTAVVQTLHLAMFNKDNSEILDFAGITR